MPVTPVAQLDILRDQHPQTALVEWYVAIAPYGAACFTSQVNDPGAALDRGSMIIPYDDDPSEANVSAGMTLWVGSAAGLDDIGRVRIKSIDVVADELTVAENTDIPWADDLFLTCPGAYGFREIWGVYPRMTEGPVDFLMDYDVDFNIAQDIVLPPKANAGPPAVAWIDDAGNADISFTGDHSFTPELAPADIASYAWDFADGVWQAGPGVNAAGTCLDPNIVRWTTPGFRYISLTVTDNTPQARTGTVYVPVWIFEEGVEDPFRLAEVARQDGDVSSGWRAQLKVFQTNTVAEDTIYHWPDGALVVLFTRTWFGGVEVGVGGWCMANDKHYRDNIRFVGWLLEETVQYNADDGIVGFEAVAHDGIMSMIPAWPFTLEDVAAGAATDWYEVSDLNVDRALHYLLEYYSTVNQVCDVEPVGEADGRPIEIQQYADKTLYGQAQTDLLGDANCLLLSDRQGILYATRNPQFMSAAERLAVATCVHIQQNDGDWMDVIDNTKPHRPELGQVRVGGFAGSTPLLARAPIATPGDTSPVPLQNPTDMMADGLIFVDANEAALWAGLTLTWANNEYKEIPIEMSGYWPVFDMAYQEYVQLTANDPLDRREWAGEKFIVRQVRFNDDASDGSSTTSLVVEKANDILVGEIYTVPSEVTPARPSPPPLPLPPPSVLPEGPVKAAVAWTYDQIGYTSDLLRHHVDSAATAGTAGVDLFDTEVDFEELEVAIGDMVENMTSGVYERTTVAAIVGPNQLTLTAGINLNPGDNYHVCGTQWSDITPTLVGAEYIIHVYYARSGDNVRLWCLTSDRVLYAADAFSASWSTKLTLVAVRAHDIALAAAQFRGCCGLASNDGYCIVSMDDCVFNSGFGCVYTTDYGGSWNYSIMPMVQHCDIAPFQGIVADDASNIIYTVRRAVDGGNFARLLLSADFGASFAWTAGDMSTWVWDTTGYHLYKSFSGGDIQAAIRTWPADDDSPKHSPDGTAWTSHAAAGYIDPVQNAGFQGWYGSAGNYVTMWKRVADNHWCLLRSTNGTAWTEVGDADPLFEETAILFAQCIAMPTQVWPPDALVIIWIGLSASGFGGSHDQCRLRYTDVAGGGGLVWFNKMGNWYTTFGSWDGANGSSGERTNAGCVALPRVGDNA